MPESDKHSTSARGRPRSQKRDKEIRDASWKLIAAVGCAGLTFEAIAQEVGCSRSTLYRRFSTKEELISHLLDETARSFAPQFEANSSPRDMLITHAATCAEMYSGDRGAALLHIAAAARGDEMIANAFDKHLQIVSPHYYAPLRELAHSVDSDRLHFALHTLMGSVVHHVAVRRHKLCRSDIIMLVDASIQLCRNDAPITG